MTYVTMLVTIFMTYVTMLTGGNVARVHSIPEAVRTSWVVPNEQQHGQN